jgi:cytochrome P450
VLRNVVRPSFAAREILAMEDYVRGHVRELLARLREQGGGDFAQDVALPLVFGVSMRLMGASASDSLSSTAPSSTASPTTAIPSSIRWRERPTTA